MNLVGMSISCLKSTRGGMSGSIRQVLHQLLVTTLTKLLMASILPQTFISIVSSCPCIQLVIGSSNGFSFNSISFRE